MEVISLEECQEEEQEWRDALGVRKEVQETWMIARMGNPQARFS